MTTITVRKMQGGDEKDWAQMRCALWPSESYDHHLRDGADILTSKDQWAFIARTTDFKPIGFAEVSVRKYANGCTIQPVAFLEGIWVAESFRRQNIGDDLIAHVSEFMARKGFKEICSDAHIENTPALNAHASWGFSETERVVYFRKSI